MKMLTTMVVIALAFQQSFATTWLVGPTRTYVKPSQVMGLVDHGDTVLIDAGEYVGDVGQWAKNNLVIKGVGGFAHMRANGQHAQGKAIWVIKGNDTTVEWIEFSEASVPDKNGAGIRQEGINLTVRHCYFHDSEEGILAGDKTGSHILVEFSEFARNGYGDGLSHNIYVNRIDTFTLRYCYMHHAKIGHQVKSRAHNNLILYNRIMDETSGTSSMLLDLPNGGLSFVIGNVFMQGPNAENKRLIAYGAEGLSNSDKRLYVVNNTMVNKRHTGTFVFVQNGTTEAKLINNIAAGVGNVLEGTATMSTNKYYADFTNAPFVNEANYNYDITNDSALVNNGSAPGNIGGFDLTPIRTYLHPVNCEARFSDATLDIGAYEWEDTTVQTGIPLWLEVQPLYPNPVEDFVTVDAEDGTEVTIRNLQGQLCLRQSVYRHRIVGLGVLPPGAYLIRSSNNYVGRFMKQ